MKHHADAARAALYQRSSYVISFCTAPSGRSADRGEKNLYFPLHRVYFIGHNYSAHNKELNAPDEPVSS